MCIRDRQHSLKALKSEGLALHPIIVTRKNFGYADYPEVNFKLSFPPEANTVSYTHLDVYKRQAYNIRGLFISIDNSAQPVFSSTYKIFFQVTPPSVDL